MSPARVPLMSNTPTGSCIYIFRYLLLQLPMTSPTISKKSIKSKLSDAVTLSIILVAPQYLALYGPGLYAAESQVNLKVCQLLCLEILKPLKAAIGI